MEYALMDLFRKGLSGQLTKEESDYYNRRYLTAEEKQIGKPLYAMSEAEEIEYDALCFNNKAGTLTGYNCPICKNKGEIMVVKDRVKYYPECSCMQIRRCVENMQRSGLGELLNQKKFSNFEQKEDWQKHIVIKAKQFIDSSSNGLLFSGVSVCGKTHICTAISRALLNKGIPLKYFVWQDEVPKIKQLVRDCDKYSVILNELKTIPALYIDDFLKTKKSKNGKVVEPTEADIRLAIEIINARYVRNQTNKDKFITIVSTEWTIKELNDFDNSLCGRLCEMAGKDFILSVYGEDKNYRLRMVLGDNK